MLRPILIITISLFSSSLFAKKVQTVKVKETSVVKIVISHRGAVLNFPSKPSKVIVGNSTHFSVEYINNDLVVSPLRSDGRSHFFVYLGGRRFNLDVIASSKGATLVQVRDDLDSEVEVPYVR